MLRQWPFAAVLVLLMSGALRLGREVEQLKADRDWWRERYLASLDDTERAVRAGERIATIAPIGDSEAKG